MKRRQPGAGRKPIGRVPKRSITLRLDADVVDYARHAGPTETVEGAVKRTKGYREWINAAEHEQPPSEPE